MAPPATAAQRKAGTTASRVGATATSAATVILDNGADRLKVGLAGDPEPRYRVPNCTAKLKGQLHSLVGDEIELVNNTANLTYNRPFDRGYLNNWASEYPVWRRVFGEGKLKVDPSSTQLLVTEPPFTPGALAGYSAQVIFEEFGFAACAKLPAASLAAHRYRSEKAAAGAAGAGAGLDCVLVVDSGFSFTHVVPYYRGKAVRPGVKRVNVGGKLLTNFLKETVSYRQWNMMDEFQLMNDAKEALCYVSQDFDAEMARLRPGGGPNRRRPKDEDPIRRDFVLPDFQTTMKGYVRDPRDVPAPAAAARGGGDGGAGAGADDPNQQQVLAMEVERFVVPEVLFRPSDVGLRQAGLPEAIVQAVEDCDVALRGPLYANILLTGGNVRLPGLATRLEAELQALVPDHYIVSITTPPDPVDYAWKGGALMAQQHQQGGSSSSLFVTKQTYDEYGVDACQERFFDQLW